MKAGGPPARCDNLQRGRIPCTARPMPRYSSRVIVPAMPNTVSHLVGPAKQPSSRPLTAIVVGVSPCFPSAFRMFLSRPRRGPLQRGQRAGCSSARQNRSRPRKAGETAGTPRACGVKLPGADEVARLGVPRPRCRRQGGASSAGQCSPLAPAHPRHLPRTGPPTRNKAVWCRVTSGDPDRRSTASSRPMAPPLRRPGCRQRP